MPVTDHHVSPANPAGTDGFEFVEYASLQPEGMERLFASLGFVEVARHRSKNVTLWRQGGINFILNAEKQSHAGDFYTSHGPSVSAIAFRVHDAQDALKRVASLGAEVVESRAGPMEAPIPAIKGIGGSLIYLVDRHGAQSIYDFDFIYHDHIDHHPRGVGLTSIDHLTHNVYRGQMNVRAEFYTRLFNFREIRYFDIDGKLTGLKSRAMTSPCGKIRIPINESADDKSQIEEYLRTYKGEGIQHIALATADIYDTVEVLKANSVPFMAAPRDAYYTNIPQRVPHHDEDIARLQRNGILIDGAPESRPGANDGGILLQIFTDTVIGPIFYEIIQRKGDEGFGEGNFKVLFESIEEDQLRRGVLTT